MVYKGPLGHNKHFSHCLRVLQLAIRSGTHASEEDRRGGSSNQAKRSPSIPKESQFVHRPTFKGKEDGNGSGRYCAHQGVRVGGTGEISKEDRSKHLRTARVTTARREPEPLREVHETMASHLQPKKLVLAERYGLMSQTQRPGQTLRDYYAELQKAAAKCEFEKIKDRRDAMVTMVFIGGLASIHRD
uniref:Retrotrans_gag domain-containing protein n=1 Tax=Haemonchus contortus TaxID=6289 RepID=A0A7I4Z6E3_HAECO